ncbi:phosphoribosyltransferase family protein [Psychroflexus salis]|uniref:Phosphoribosyltransferase n=1 Tax=Psychroflexus salis TaxID=1526574 RepID=A0A916ZWA8_9FLAO|nr:phosphoribosyltransferase family protein [Psychroflexus salis]GGE16579.1 phosphoribosyltransferase [Psychroflexus salis]
MKQSTNHIILNANQIQQKTKRIAFQILEDHLHENEIILVGIKNSGYAFAEALGEELKNITNIDIKLGSLSINKRNPIEALQTSLKVDDYQDKCVVVVDDVLNSGATLIYAVKHFLAVPLKQLKTAVLVDRSHKKFPVKANYKGLSLSTSLQETVQVEFGKNAKVSLY